MASRSRCICRKYSVIAGSPDVASGDEAIPDRCRYGLGLPRAGQSVWARNDRKGYANAECSDGFSFIEILLCIALLAVLATAGIPVSVSWYRAYQLQSERIVLERLLQTARGRAMANLNNVDHGVYIHGGSYTLFQGTIFDSGSLNNETTPVGSALVAATPEAVTFSKYSGAATPALIILSATGGSTRLSVNAEGLVE